MLKVDWAAKAFNRAWPKSATNLPISHIYHCRFIFCIICVQIWKLHSPQLYGIKKLIHFSPLLLSLCPFSALLSVFGGWSWFKFELYDTLWWVNTLNHPTAYFFIAYLSQISWFLKQNSPLFPILIVDGFLLFSFKNLIPCQLPVLFPAILTPFHSKIIKI